MENPKSFSLKMTKVGEPLEVVEKMDITQEVFGRQLKDDEVLIQYMASPINPSDFLYCRGLYSEVTELPASLGFEGVAKIIKVGPSVKNFQVNDWVLVKELFGGSWSTHAIKSQSSLFKVDNSLDVFAAAQLMINPPTAYRMMKDFVDLKAGMF